MSSVKEPEVRAQGRDERLLKCLFETRHLTRSNLVLESSPALEIASGPGKRAERDKAMAGALLPISLRSSFFQRDKDT